MTTTHYILVYPVEGLENVEANRYGLTITNIADKGFTDIYDDELKNRLQDSQLKDIYTLGLERYCYLISEECNEGEQIKILYDFFSILTIIKPSTITFPITSFQINYNEKDGVKERWQITISTFYEPQHIFNEDMLPLEIDDVDLFHTLSDNFFKNLDDEYFLRLVNLYSEAIRAKRLFLKFLMLVMILEMLIKDDTMAGVSYKIRRICAVLLGSDNGISETIFENIKSIYNVRSLIVHSVEMDKLYQNMIDYMHCIACEILNTFLLGSITLKTLFNKSTKYGYGQRSQLLAEYGITLDSRFENNQQKLKTNIK